MHCLVVDPNMGFAQLLSEELRQLGHDVSTCTTAKQAVMALRKQKAELAFLDMALRDPDTLTLAKALRKFDAGMRLVLVPLMGQQTVDHDSVPVQGILPKPFFPPELPDRIDAAMQTPLDGSAKPVYESKEQDLAELLPEDTRPQEPKGRKPMSMDGEIVVRMHQRDPNRRDETQVVYEGGLAEDDDATLEVTETVVEEPLKPGIPVVVKEPPVEEPLPIKIAPPEDADLIPEDGGLDLYYYEKNRARIMKRLENLADEVKADGALLSHRGDLLLTAGNLKPAEAESVAAAVYQGWITSVKVARALGQEQIRFEQSIEGGSYLLYALSVASDAIMTVVVRNTRSLGMLRLNARQTAERIAEMCDPY